MCLCVDPTENLRLVLMESAHPTLFNDGLLPLMQWDFWSFGCKTPLKTMEPFTREQLDVSQNCVK